MILRYSQFAPQLAAAFRPRWFSSTAASLGKATKVSKELASLRTLSSEEDHKQARAWIQGFSPNDVPREELEVSYARSSGPGGQHVNKTNSKAVVRIDIHKAKWLPPFVLPALQKTSADLKQYYHAPNLLFQSQESRSAPQNLDRALSNLHSTILSAARSLVRGETSPEQRERVRGLAEADKARRKELKMRMKAKKGARRGDF